MFRNDHYEELLVVELLQIVDVDIIKFITSEKLSSIK
jgi:hypothetical protein